MLGPNCYLQCLECLQLFVQLHQRKKLKENKCELCLAITPAFLSTMSNNSVGTEQYSAFWNLFLAQINNKEQENKLLKTYRICMFKRRGFIHEAFAVP